MKAEIDNASIYETHWPDWVDMKRHGPASRWLRILVKRALADVDRSTIQSVLDVGCGEGTLSVHLGALLPEARVRGIDVVASGIHIARQAYPSSNLSFEHESIDDDPRTYDLVTAFEVLEHIEDWRPFLASLARHSHRNLLLSFPTGRMRDFEVHVGHYRNYARGEVETELSRLGFEPVSVSYAGFPFYSPFYRELCNLTNAASNSFTTGKYGFLQKRASDLLLALFLLSTRRRRGDQFCGLFRRTSVS